MPLGYGPHYHLSLNKAYSTKEMKMLHRFMTRQRTLHVSVTHWLPSFPFNNSDAQGNKMTTANNTNRTLCGKPLTHHLIYLLNKK